MSKYTDDILTHLINSQTAVTKLKDGIEDLINDMDNLYAKVEDSIQMPDSVEIKIEIIQNGEIVSVMHVDNDEARIVIQPEE